MTKVGKMSTVGNMWLWMGAAISIAEIMTGAMFASLGVRDGLLATFIGRLVGTTFLAMAGYIGAKLKANSMESVQLSFGNSGRKIFALLNMLQLVGWTAVMVINGANAVGLFLGREDSVTTILSCVIIGLLIVFWLILGNRNLEKINSLTVLGLMVCCGYVSYQIMTFTGQPAALPEGDPVSFGLAVELSLAMPLSWIPLIADYNKEAENPVKANVWGAVSYGLGGFWMSSIGLLAAIYTGYTDVSALMSSMGLGLAGIFVIILSTVTTTYLDVKSAAISFGSILSVPGEKIVSLLVIVAGVLLAVYYDTNRYMEFLYYIGSCFAPMVAILITDYFLLGKRTLAGFWNPINGIIWILGFAFYRYLITLSLEGFDPIIGISIPVLLVVMAVTYGVGCLKK